MKNLFLRNGIYFLIILLAGCEERKPQPINDFYLFADIDRIKVTLSSSQYSLYISPPVTFSAEGTNSSGKRVVIPDSLLSFTLNGQPLGEKRVIPSDTGAYVIQARFGYLESAPVTIRASNIISSVEVVLSRPLFYFNEESRPVSISAIIRDKDRNLLNLLDSSSLKVLVDDIPQANHSFLPMRPGEFRVKAILGQQESKPTILKSVDPANVARHVRLTAHSIGGTHLGIAGKNEPFKFQAKVYDENFNELPLSKDIRFLSNGSQINGATFGSPHAGVYKITARGYGLVSEPIEIIMRQERAYPGVTLPVIVHFIDIAPPSDNELSRVLESLNAAFRGDNRDTLAQDPNSVNTYIQFSWATHSPDGTKLARPGVHEVTVGRGQYKASEISNSEPDNPCWTNFWNPNRYMNVWVLKIPDAQWSGLGSLPFVSDIPRSEPPNWPHGTWLNGGLHWFTLIHEFGHNLGLYHTFNGSPVSGIYLSKEESCARDADGCEDTPNYQRTDTERNHTRVSCTGASFISTNYMDYDPTAGNSFTYDQRTLMRNRIENAIWLPTLRNRNLRIAAGTSSAKTFPRPVILP